MRLSLEPINSLLSPYTPGMPADEQWSSPAHLTDAKECGHVGLKQVWLSARGEARRGALIATWSRTRSIADQRQRAGESVLRATPERQGSDVNFLSTQFHLRSHIVPAQPVLCLINKIGWGGDRACNGPWLHALQQDCDCCVPGECSLDRR